MVSVILTQPRRRNNLVADEKGHWKREGGSLYIYINIIDLLIWQYDTCAELIAHQILKKEFTVHTYRIYSISGISRDKTINDKLMYMHNAQRTNQDLVIVPKVLACEWNFGCQYNLLSIVPSLPEGMCFLCKTNSFYSILSLIKKNSAVYDWYL